MGCTSLSAAVSLALRGWLLSSHGRYTPTLTLSLRERELCALHLGFSLGALAVAGACEPVGHAPHVPAHLGQHLLHGGRAVGSGVTDDGFADYVQGICEGIGRYVRRQKRCCRPSSRCRSGTAAGSCSTWMAHPLTQGLCGPPPVRKDCGLRNHTCCILAPASKQEGLLFLGLYQRTIPNDLSP